MSILQVLVLLLIKSNKYVWKHDLTSSDKREKGLRDQVESLAILCLGNSKSHNNGDDLGGAKRM